MKVVWTDAAAQDLTEIVDYIADDSPEAARRVAEHIFSSVAGLSTTPYIGRKRTADDSPELIFLPWPYLALYGVIGDKVYIEAIRHTSQDWSEFD
jgi:plasmid stabilization system protein ParE